jgi:hypothetical protein
MTVLKELSKCKLDLVRAQEVKWEGCGTETVGEYTFFYRKGNENHYICTRIFVHKRIVSAGRGRWRYIIVLNIHAPTEDKTDDVKDSFYKELECVFDIFVKYHTKILLGDFNAKVGREDIFKLTIWNKSLHEISNDNGVGLVNFAISKNLRVKSMMFSHRNIHKYT